MGMDEIIIETSGSSWTGIIWITALVILSLLGVTYGIWRLKRLLTQPEMYGLSREEIVERWKNIRLTSRQGTMGAKVAIMEADTLLDSVLKSLSMPGQTLGERLKMACYKYPHLKTVWWAHKIRNQLAHEASFQLSQRQAEQALDEFEKALKILNVF